MGLKGSNDVLVALGFQMSAVHYVFVTIIVFELGFFGFVNFCDMFSSLVFEFLNFCVTFKAWFEFFLMFCETNFLRPGNGKYFEH